MEGLDIFKLIKAHDPNLKDTVALVYTSSVQALIRRNYIGDGSGLSLMDLGYKPSTAHMYGSAWMKFIAACESAGIRPPVQVPTAEIEQAVLTNNANGIDPDVLRGWRTRVQAMQEPETEVTRRVFMPIEVRLALRETLKVIPVTVMPSLVWGYVRYQRKLPMDPVVYTGVMLGFRGVVDGQVFDRFVKEPEGYAHLRTLWQWAGPAGPEAPIVPTLRRGVTPMSATELTWLSRLKMPKSIALD